jgi:hypothetical protein
MMDSLSLDMNVESDNTLITSISHTNFLGITIENILYWKSHIDQLLCKLSAACYVVSSQNVYNSRNISYGLLCLLSFVNELQHHCLG